ncbi:MAG: tetratricopeptide repeat protein [bacterium]
MTAGLTLAFRGAARRAAAALIALAVLAVAAAVFGEQPPPDMGGRERALRDVRALVRSGAYDAAILKLRSLSATYPNDPLVTGALFQALVETKRYDEAEAVMVQFLAARPDDPKGLADLASLYLVTGRRGQALNALDRIVASAPDELGSYQIAYQVLWRNSAPGDAVNFILRARRATGDSAAFAFDAAQLYKLAGKPDSATVEYLVAAAAEGNPEIAVDGVVAMADSAEGGRTVIATLDAQVARPGVGEIARACLWQVYILNGECARAFDEVSALGRVGALSPEVLALFAARSRERACYAECGRAYDLALSLPANRSQFPMLMINKAGCQLAGGLVAEAEIAYREVVSGYPDTKWAGEAQLALCGILRDAGRFVEAAAAADKVIESKAAGEARYDAILFKGDCLVRSGALEEAFTTYDLVATDWKPGYAQEAFYNLGEIKFYQGAFEDATSYYNVTLRQYPDEPRANDAIDRLMLLKAVKGDLGTIWLKDLARAGLLEREGKVDEAAGILKNLAADPGQGSVKVESLKSLSRIYADRGEYDRALRLYKLLADTLVTSYSPGALEAIGDVYMASGRVGDAVRTYEDVIVRFPESVSAGEARRKLDVAKRQSR